MSSYFIESFKIDKLWGYRNIDLTFNNNVNILIGPNGSGKTTILNLLHAILSGDLRSVVNFNFQQAKIGLKSFKGNSVRTIKVDIEDKFLKLKVGEKKYEAPIDIFSRQRPVRSPLRDFYERGNVITNLQSEDINNELTPLVPLIWLPVSRCLPLTEDEEEWYTRTELLELMDLRLGDLLEGLSRYHSRLNTQLSERYREFEREVLSVILWDSKDQNNLTSMTFSLPSKKVNIDKERLLGAFADAGLLDEQMQNKIDGHFTKAEEVVKIARKDPNSLTPADLLAVPLISRTQAMVEYARKLEEDREKIFAPLRSYEDTVNSFLNHKSIKVDESGQLKIRLSSSMELDWHLLSSGEKQILILLTEALLRVDEPVVYIADEPELSLHVTWQEKLLESLVTLGGQKQIIVATHSPDIVGDFRDKVIDLGEGS